MGRIDKELAQLPKPSDYLYETNSVSGQIVGTWTEMTANILGTRELRVAYDNFYQSSVEYAGMVEINLLRARKAALNNDAETANRLLGVALRYESQFHLNDKAAIEAFNGNIDAAAELARGIYEGSKAATIYGSSMVLGPVGSRVVDTVFDATDFAVEASDSGLTSAAKKLVAGKLTEMIFSQATVTTLGGRTLEDAIDRGVTKTLGNPEVYKIVREVVSKPEFAKAFMGFMAKSGSHVVSGLTEDQVNKIVMAFIEGTSSKAPSFTDCGSNWYQRLGLQFLEVEQATRGGYSFNVACQAHDACYGDCRTIRSDCDKKLLADTEGVCESAQNRANCIADAQIFFQAVSEKGDTPFKQARANCPATVGLPSPSNEDIRSIDFRNHDYPLSRGGISDFKMSSVRVKNGKFIYRNDEYYGLEGFKVSKVLFHDLTGDGREEAIIETETGFLGENLASAQWPWPDIYVYTLINGQEKLLTMFNWDDIRTEYNKYYNDNMLIYWWLTGAKSGEIILGASAGKGICCPDFDVSLPMRWNGKRFILNTRPTRSRV